MGKVAKRDPADIDLGHAVLSKTGIQFKGPMTFEDFETVGAFIKRVDQAKNWWWGDWLNYGEGRPEWGDKYQQVMNDTGLAYSTINHLKSMAKRCEFSHRWPNLDWTHHLAVFEQAALTDKQRTELLEECSAEKTKTGKAPSCSELRKKCRELATANLSTSSPLPEGKYQCLVIDPPWPVQKIEREERPKQGQNLDYHVMSMDSLRQSLAEMVKEKSADTCHVYLWVTQKYLPIGLEMLAEWGFDYQCVMTWIKPTGMTPFSWMYNTEHVLFGGKGGLRLERMGLKLSFEAKVERHSAKPDEFFARVVEASPGPRLSMYERTKRDGFDVWGSEAPNE